MGKLTHKEKVAIVRDVLIERPRYWAYGWNRDIIKLFKKKFEITFKDSYISKLKKETLNQMKDDKKVILTKEKLIEMHIRIFEKYPFAIDKTRSLIEIGKLEGHYEEKLKISEDITNGELKALADRIIAKKIKEKNGKKENLKKEKKNEKDKNS